MKDVTRMAVAGAVIAGGIILWMGFVFLVVRWS